MTGTRTKILGTSTYLYTVSFYDEKGRLIQVQATNITGGTDIMTTQYSWAGQPLVAVNKTEKGTPNAHTTVVVTQMTYDDLGRVKKVEKKMSHSQVNSGAMPSTFTTVLQNEYDKLGQLQTKKDGNKQGGGALAKLDYEYNIRSWMLSVNKDYITNSSNADQYFGMQLGYDKNGSLGTFTPMYNGNISGTIWKSEGDQEKRKYDFTYDAANRLTAANFTQYVSGSGSSAIFNTSANIDFTVSELSYDNNGNIMTMIQKGLKLNSSPTIDNLTYQYQSGSNKLAKVSDGITEDMKLGDFKDGSNGSTDDYSYDGNGNLTVDNNKAISSITYNHLNLPSVITVTGKGTITYTYDAAGNKIKKVTVDNTVNPSKTTTTLYIGGSVYQNDTLQFTSHEEGRIRFKPTAGANPTSLQYDYFLKDHLGNVRMVLTEEQQSDMYPQATMETANATVEETYYSNLPATRTDAPGGYPGGAQKVAKVRGDGNKIGPAMILKVMAGDKINLIVNSYWAGGSPDQPVSPLNDLITALSNNVASVAGGKATSNDLTSSGLSSNAATSFLNNQSYTSGKPKAYINWILLDEQFKPVITNNGKNSGFEQVQTSGSIYSHSRTNWELTKNGYLYIYVSNETPNIDVFFDNLQVTHIRGPILEETHYSPWGLTLANISSKALLFGNPENKRKFNKGSELQNREFSDGSGLELYATNFRSLDPQLGRWWQIDPKPDYSQSLYSAMGNNPILFNDPLGDTVKIKHGGFLGIGRKTTVYRDGKLYNKDGKTAYTGKIKGFLEKTTGALDKIRTGGPGGKELVGKLQKSTENFHVVRGSNAFDENKGKVTNVISWSPGNKSGGPDANGNTNRPSFVGLAHELGHGYDKADDGVINRSPFITVGTGDDAQHRGMSEVIASHWENMVRAEHGINLRAAYYYGDDGSGTKQFIGRLIVPGTSLSWHFYNGSTIDIDGVTHDLDVPFDYSKKDGRFGYHR